MFGFGVIVGLFILIGLAVGGYFLYNYLKAKVTPPVAK